MRIYRSIRQLQRDSVIVLSGTVAVSPLGEEKIDTSFATAFDGCYCVSNATIGYVWHKILYVTPYTQGAEKLLNELSYKEAQFNVPFSDYSYPKKQESYWARLLHEALDDALLAQWMSQVCRCDSSD